MKMQKTARAVLMLAAGLTSGAALAGQSVTWGPSDSGTAKDVNWEALHPSNLSFTMTTDNIESIDGTGKINNTGNSVVGSWKNPGSASVAFEVETFNGKLPPDFDGVKALAEGDKKSTAKGPEYLQFVLKTDQNSYPLHDGCAWPSVRNGKPNCGGKGTRILSGQAGGLEQGKIWVATRELPGNDDWIQAKKLEDFQSTKFIGKFKVTAYAP